MSTRISDTFQRLQQEQRTGLVTFFMANDPTPDDFSTLLNNLPQAGVDIIEIGMPFSDPVADGVSIQAAGQRSLAHGTHLDQIFSTVDRFRKKQKTTPLVLMGYLNPILHYGTEAFFQQCATSGVDGIILVDLSPEEESDIRHLAQQSGIELIRLITPTTSEQRIQEITKNCGGFIYFVAVSGITGTKSADISLVENNIATLRKNCDLPLAVGFGIKDNQSAKDTARVADAIVIGSALVDYCYQQFQQGKTGSALSQAVSDKVRAFSSALNDQDDNS